MKNIKKYMPSIAFLLAIFIFFGAFLIAPKKDFSENEKRILSDAPEVSFENLANGKLTKDFEAYVSDHFPLRDFFVGVQSYFDLLCGRNGTADVYYCKDGYLISAPADVNVKTTENNVKAFKAFADKNKLDATMIVVPSIGYTMEEMLPQNHKQFIDDEIIDTAKANCGDIKFIDLRESFESVKNDVQLYYRTDHHLTSAGAYEMYKLFAESKGFSTSAEYDVETVKGFYGTAYSKGGYWLSDPDNIELWHNKNLKVKVEIIETGKEPVTSNSVFFKNQLENADKYPVFLDGNHSLVKITNPDAKGGKLLIVKDSFAHCFTGFLAEQYSEIYMVDMRYYRTPLTDLVTENAIPEVLYLYGTDNLGTDTNCVWMQ